jgi:hypothetical protein
MDYVFSTTTIIISVLALAATVASLWASSRSKTRDLNVEARKSETDLGKYRREAIKLHQDAAQSNKFRLARNGLLDGSAERNFRRASEIDRNTLDELSHKVDRLIEIDIGPSADELRSFDHSSYEISIRYCEITDRYRKSIESDDADALESKRRALR